jgi:uncharacterized protein (DUF488 family)
LLRNETASRGGSSFYDFVPYRFGPYSFSLYEEVDKLVNMSYIVQDDHGWQFNYELSDRVPALGPMEREVNELLENYIHLPLDSLLDYIYENYPSYTVNSEKRRLQQRPTIEPAIFTAGYERLSIDGFLDILVRSGIELLIDVRSNPVSRRYGFHKSRLMRLSEKVGIDYSHFPELGIHYEKRQRVRNQNDADVLFEEYERSTLVDELDAIHRVSLLVSSRPSVLVCLEADPARCHRSRLAKRIAGLTGLSISDLRSLT